MTQSIRLGLRQSLVLLIGFCFVTQSYAVSPVTTYEYDANGNLTKILAPLGRTTVNTYDALNRIKTVTDPMSGISQYAYDGRGQIASVTDPRLHSTVYSVDGLGNQSQEVSPDRGTTGQTFDEAGNLKTRTDARGKTVEYKYDSLNRLTQTKYLDGTLTRYLKYFYDQGTNSIGRLSSTSFFGGQTAYTYDIYGHVASKTDTQGSGSSERIFAVSYNWNADNGRLVSMTYPSGKVIGFGYDEVTGRIQSLNVGGTDIATNITYVPFGPPKSWTWGNGTANTRSFDLDGRMTSFIVTPDDPNTTTVNERDERTVKYDDAGRIKKIEASLNSRTHTMGYDDLDRVTGWVKGNTTTSRTYSYDANGNRTRLEVSGTPYTYTNSAVSNRLQNTAGPVPARTFVYDDAGNITGDTQVIYTYNDLGRMTEAKKGSNPTVKYTYDALGQRVKKSGDGTSYYSYDEAGHLIGTYDTNGAPVQEYVYLGDMPLAVLTGTTAPMVYYVYTDQVMKPWSVTDVFDQQVWKWDTSPFGEDTANPNPLGTTGNFAFNLRFPGQHYDKETGLFYNYFRDYDPQTGRYMESDPIGLEGGLNTYAYVGGDPLNRIDPLGLWSTAAHDAFIDKFFPNLDPNLRNAIKAGSAEADYLYYQDDAHSFMHGMSSAKLSKGDAKEGYCNFIKEKIEEFKRRLATARSTLAIKAAYAQLGMALHAVMDSTSPAHRGFQKWEGDATRHGPYVPIVHTDTIEDVRHMGPYESETLEKMRYALKYGMPLNANASSEGEKYATPFYIINIAAFSIGYWCSDLHFFSHIWLSVYSLRDLRSNYSGAGVFFLRADTRFPKCWNFCAGDIPSFAILLSFDTNFLCCVASEKS